MAHIEDRWYRTIIGPDARKRREKTNLHGKGMRYRVRYIDPTGRERSKSFPDRAKDAAEAFLVSVEHDKREGTYLDPDAGEMRFESFAKGWLVNAGIDESTRENYESRLRNHILPFFGHRTLKAIKPGTVQAWDRKAAESLAASTRAVNFAILQAILNAAIDDERIRKNPCAAKSVTAPRPEPRKVAPWSPATVMALRNGLMDRYRTMVDLCAGCGHRQGEAFGLAVDDIDADGGLIYVRRQVKRVNCRLVFGLPKADKEREVPLPSRVARALKVHMEAFPPTEITLPWESPNSTKLVTARLVFSNLGGRAINRNAFDPKQWHPALRGAGLPVIRANGMHALRHFYASALLDAGENIKALSQYLGHWDPGFTLRVYAHLMPGSQDRARRAIDDLFGESGPDGLATA